MGLFKDFWEGLKPYKLNAGEAQGVSEIQALGYDYINASIYSMASEKRQLLSEYKEMSMFPEVSEGIDEIIFEAINPDKNGKIISLNISDPDLLENENIVANLQKEFDYVLNNVLDFNTNADDLFRKFFIEGELYGEYMIDPKKKERGITGIQILPSYSMSIIYDEKQNPTKFKQDLSYVNIISPEHRNRIHTTAGNEIYLEPIQVAYVNSGIIDYNRNLVYSYLERSKIAFRQLKWMESSLLIYRVTRAPERRVWSIDVGKLPKNKADEYIKSMITRYKNKKIYNPATGEVDVGKEVQSMQEDIYLPKRSDGSGSTVETLPGGANLGELSDVNYFLQKLYKSLKIPLLRMQADSIYSSGRSSEITREELKFSKYINRIRSRFLDFVTQTYLTHLQLKGLYSQYKLNKTKINLKFNEANEWKELKDLEMKRARIDIFKDMIEYKDEIFPVKYLYKSVMNLNDQEILEIETLLKEQTAGKTEEKTEKPEEGKKKEELPGNKLLIGNEKGKVV